MQILLLALFVSWLVTMLVLRYSHLHERFSADHDLDGVQKFHVSPVPRIGGVPLLLGLMSAALFATQRRPGCELAGWLLVCSLPAFGAGLLEDLTKRVGPLPRLVMTMVAAAAGWFFLGASIERLDVFWIDGLVRYVPISFALTMVAVAGVANAVNLIDGYNGLAGVVVAIIALALAYVAYLVGDSLLWNMSLALAGGMVGFLLWNYPRGLIFLGDGGAYLAGFMVAELAVLLVARHPQVSAWFPLLLLIYPIVETLFTIWRRAWLRGGSPGIPDAAHLHQLIYKRLVRWAVGSRHVRHRITRNAMTSPYLWILSSLGVMPAVVFWGNTRALQVIALVFVGTYVWLYRRIVRFNVPRWLIVRLRTSQRTLGVESVDKDMQK